jgi:hypothetical protein
MQLISILTEGLSMRCRLQAAGRVERRAAEGNSAGILLHYYGMILEPLRLKRNVTVILSFVANGMPISGFNGSSERSTVILEKMSCSCYQTLCTVSCTDGRLST